MVNFSGSQSIHHRFRTEELRSLNEFAKIVEYRLVQRKLTSGLPMNSNHVMQKRIKYKDDDC